MAQELEDIKRELAELRMDVKLCINYMRELAVIIGAKERLAALDRELADQERRDTDRAPVLPENGDTQP
jgi:hypothetical protein